MKKSKFLTKLMAGVMLITSLGLVNVAAAERENNVITEFGNTSEIAGLTYCDTVGYNSTSSVHYAKTAAENTADTSLVMHPNLGMVEGSKYSISFNIKPVAMGSLWIRINGTTNGGAGSVKLDENGALVTANAKSFMTITSLGDGWYNVASNTANEHKIAWGGMALLLAPKGDVAVDFYIDDFSVKDEAGNEIVTNGGFELPAQDEETEIVRENNVITEFGNTSEIAGLTYCDTVGYNSRSSVRYAKTADENTSDASLVMHPNLGMVEGSKYSISFNIKPVAMGSLWIRINGTTNGGAGSLKLDENGALVTTNAKSFMTITSLGDGWYNVASNTANEHKIAWGGMALLLAPKGDVAVDFYIDDFSVKDEAGNEIVTNGGFEYQAPEDDTTDIVRENNVIKEFGNGTEIAGLTYCDTVGYNSTSSVRYTKTAAENTADTSLVMHPNLGMVEGSKYSISFNIKPVAMGSLWIRINGTTNGGAGSLKLDENGALAIGNGSSFMTVTTLGNGWYNVASNTANEHQIAWGGMALLFAPKGDTAVDFYIDDFSVKDEAGNEIVTNGGFEYQPPNEDDEQTEQVITRTDDIITEFGNESEINGLTYCDTVGYNSISSVRYTKTADENTTDTSLVMHPNLGMVEGQKYSISFYIKPVALGSLWIRINGTTNGGAGSLKLDENGALAIGNGPSFMTVTSAGNGWYKVASNTANEHTIAWSNMALLFAPKGDTAVDFYIDDFSIKDEAGNELVTNGGFELPTSQVGNFVVTDNTDGTKTVTATVANRAEGDDYTALLILATFDGVVMQNIAYANANTTVAEGTIQTLTQTIAVNDGESLTAFVWDSIDGMQPLTFSRELISAQ